MNLQLSWRGTGEREECWFDFFFWGGGSCMFIVMGTLIKGLGAEIIK